MSNIGQSSSAPLSLPSMVPEKCLHLSFQQIAAAMHERTAVVFDDQTLSYEELNQRANVIANQLITAGVSRHDMVGLAVERDLDLLPCILGILKAGAAYVPLDPNYPRGRLDDIIQDCSASAIVTTSEIASSLELESQNLIKVDVLQKSATWHDISQRQNPNVQSDASDIAYVIYTSGSTGKPKGVLVSHRNVIRLFTQTQPWFEFNQEDVWTLFHSFAFDFSVWEMWGALLYGGRLVVVPFELSRSPSDFYKALSRHGVTVLNQTPSAFRQLILADERLHADYPLQLRNVIFGGEALEFSSLRGWVDRHGADQPRLVNMYGITETTVHVTYRELELNDILDEPSSLIGTPIPDLELYVLDSEMQKCEPGTTGEIYVGGAGVAQGYLHRAELTAERFLPNPFAEEDVAKDAGSKLYRTGDLGRFRADGELEYLGRCDRQVQLRGFRVELGEIESALQSDPSVGQAIAIVRGAESGDQQLVAYLVPANHQVIDPDALRELVGASLPSYMVPQYFVSIDEIPLTANGKLNAAALPAPESKTFDAGNGIPPSTPTEQSIASVWSDLLNVDAVSTDRTFFELGGQSLMLAEMELRLDKIFPKQFAIVDLFQFPTIAALAASIDNKQTVAEKTNSSSRRRERKPVGLNSSGTLSPIAIVGMAAKVPGASNVHQFWENLQNGVESIRRLSEAELRAAGVSNDVIHDPRFVPVTASLDDVDCFDAEFFGISPHEAKITDPQHRLFLESAWTALEDAGYDPAQTDGDIGVFAGARPNDYRDLILRVQGPPDPATAFQTLISNEKDFLSTRVSFRLNLSGPSMTVQTGCSTSLVAVQLACQSLQLRQCSMALAGAVSVNLSYRNGYVSQKGMILSPDGHVRTFDDQAQGTVFGEGVGVVVLKRLDDAVADGDTIHAVIKTVAVNNDGSAKMGYSAPSIEGQTDVVQLAHEQCGITADKIGYVEAHGTGTFVGDPVEIEALTQAFRATTDRNQFCSIGSVKTNLGHQDVAAGVIGLIKATCAVRDGVIPKSLHFQTPNRNADLTNSPFSVATETKKWESQDGQPRRAGVSSFGIGGTNAHAIIEQAPQAVPIDSSADDTSSGNRRELPAVDELPSLLILSAKDEKSLRSASTQLADFLTSQPEVSLADVEHTLRCGRRGFGHRRAVFGETRDQIIQSLTNLDDPNAVQFDCQSIVRSKTGVAEVAFMFPGQGAQFAGMTRELYESVHSFRSDIDYFSRVADQWLSVELRDAIFSNDLADPAEANKRLSETWLAQPAIVAIEIALARLWMRHGISPSCLVGHSVGEFAAACIAGVFSIETALELTVLRGRLLQDLPRGKMLAVTLSESELQERLPNGLSLAVVNSPQHCVASGQTELIEAFAKTLADDQVACRVLHTSHAFHSPMMQPAVAQFRDAVAKHPLKDPELRLVSTVTGDWVRTGEMTQPEYWGNNIRQAVRFSQASTKLVEHGVDVFLEVGPGQTLSSLVRMQPDMKGSTVRSTRHPKETTGDVDQWMKSYAQLWANGVDVSWPQQSSKNPKRISLPTYPFQRTRHWIEDAPPGSLVGANGNVQPQEESDPAISNLVNAEIAAALPQQHEPFEDWFYTQSWKPKPAGTANTGTACWLMLVNSDTPTSLQDSLRQDGHTCITATPGKSFSDDGQGRFVINPDRPEDYDRLLNALKESNLFPSQIVHFWQWKQAIAISSQDSDWRERIDQEQSLGLYSLQHLAQALGRIRLDQPIQLSIVSDAHASSITDATPEAGVQICPSRATLVGAAKVIPIEYPQIQCRLIDVPLRREQWLLNELNSHPDDVWVAFRDGERCVPAVKRYSLDDSFQNTNRLQVGGTYLITGGLGGIGFTIARHLIETVQANIVLLGRSSLPDRAEWPQFVAKHGEEHSTSQKIGRLRELQSLGSSKVIFQAADVSDPNQLCHVLESAIDQVGKISGVVHAAGVADTAGAIQLRDKQATERMLQSKVQGTLALQVALADQPLDFWVLFSSISNVLYHNRYGQLSYVAGNSFLESFAAKVQQSGTRAVAIASDEWQSIGMAAEVARDFAESFGSQQRLFDPLDSFTPEQGAQMFQRILASDAPAVLISTRDLQQRIDLDVHAKSPFLEAAREGGSTADTATETIAAGIDGPEQIAQMWQKLLSIPKVAPNDNYFELGGDSLSAVRFLVELEKTFGRQLPFATMVEFPTPAKLADHLGLAATSPNAAGSSVKPDQSARASGHRSTLTELETTSDGPNIFCMHAADGYALIFRDLAKRLSGDYSVYGLQSPALFGDALESIEALATRYVVDIRNVQPQGPYLLTGYCMGGTIALEVAQQLKAEGEQAVLICIETYNWTTSRAADDGLSVRVVYYLQKFDFHIRNFLKLNLRDKTAFVCEKWKVLSRRKKVWISKLMGKTQIADGGDTAVSPAEIWRRHDEIAELYEPSSYDGTIVLIRPQADYHRYRDDEFPTTKGVQIYRMPVYPAGMMVEPFVEQLVVKFTECLEQQRSKLNG